MTPARLEAGYWISAQYLRYAAAMSRSRYRYEPEDSGWIGISNPWGILAHIDCRQGGAQRAFAELCHDFERAGWQLEGRKFDWQFVHKGTMRWEIRIGVLGPGEKMRRGWGDPLPGLAPLTSSGPKY